MSFLALLSLRKGCFLKFLILLVAAKLKLLNVSEEEKARVASLTHELMGLVRNTLEILPLFLAMTNEQSSVRKILTMVRPFSPPSVSLFKSHSLTNVRFLALRRLDYSPIR